jgi:hypothetical protein
MSTPEKPLHIDIPVKLSEAKAVFRLAGPGTRLDLQG